MKANRSFSTSRALVASPRLVRVGIFALPTRLLQRSFRKKTSPLPLVVAFLISLSGQNRIASRRESLFLLTLLDSASTGAPIWDILDSPADLGSV